MFRIVLARRTLGDCVTDPRSSLRTSLSQVLKSGCVSSVELFRPRLGFGFSLPVPVVYRVVRNRQLGRSRSRGRYAEKMGMGYAVKDRDTESKSESRSCVPVGRSMHWLLCRGGSGWNEEPQVVKGGTGTAPGQCGTGREGVGDGGRRSGRWLPRRKSLQGTGGVVDGPIFRSLVAVACNAVGENWYASWSGVGSNTTDAAGTTARQLGGCSTRAAAIGVVIAGGGWGRGESAQRQRQRGVLQCRCVSADPAAEIEFWVGAGEEG